MHFLYIYIYMKTKTEIFIEKAKIVHFGENLDYSQVVYKNNRTPVKIIDHDLDENGVEYGEFWQTPYNHLKGQCHPKKRAKRISLGKRSKQEDIIARFKEVHKGENLDYSQVNYVNMHTKVKIISHDLRPDGTEYGEFWQEPAVHLKGCTHPLIAANIGNYKEKYTKEDFLKAAQKKHPDFSKYDFSKTEYISSKEKVCITCTKIGKNGLTHGDFYIEPNAFIQGKGCPICGNNISKNEQELYEYVCSIVGKEKVVKRDKKVLNGKELDILIPPKKIAIEYNGLKWHSEEFRKDRQYHLSKTKGCKAKGIRLIQIFEDEYFLKKDIVYSKIAHLIGLQQNLPKIMARKCTVKEICANDASEFLENNHIQGFVDSTVHLGAYYCGELVAVMSFKREKKTSNEKWELTRFASDNRKVCQGIGGKLFKHFIREYSPSEIKSFADRRWTINEESNIYIKLGFKFEGYLAPEYRYYNAKVDRYHRFHKFGFRKQILAKKYGFPMTMTETEMTEALGYKKIWDCGLIKYVWKKTTADS